MVHEKYIKRGEKVHGPYYYKSYRDSEGHVKKVYLGKNVSNKNTVTLQESKRFTKGFYITIFVLIAFIFLSFTLEKPSITGKAVDDVVSFGILEPVVEEEVIEENKIDLEEPVVEELIPEEIKPNEEIILEEVKEEINEEEQEFLNETDENINFENQEMEFKKAGLISECDTLNVADTYTLTADVESNDTCFNITASDVILDCNGFMINYSTNESVSYGVNATGVDGITIMNCIFNQDNESVTGQYAIFFEDSQDNVVEYNNITTFSYGSPGIICLLCNSSNFTNNNLTINDSWGVFINDSYENIIEKNEISTYNEDDYGIFTNLAYNNSIITNNITTSGKGSYNIYESYSEYNNITSNNITSWGNLTFSISLLHSNYSLIDYNDINSDSFNGMAFYLYNSSYNNVILNNFSVTNISGYGSLTLGDADWNNISENILTTVEPNANQRAVHLSGSSNYLSDNIIESNSSYGIIISVMDGISGPTTNNYLLNNNISTNSSIYSIGDAVSVFGAYENSLVYNNTYGMINWTNGNLTTNITLNISVDSVILENNNIGFFDDIETYELNNSFGASELSTAAKIEIKQLNHTSTPYLFKNDYRCDNVPALCNISYDIGSGILYANVSSFSNYTTDLEPVTTISFSDASVAVGESLTVSCSATDSGGNIANLSMTGDSQSCSDVDSDCSFTYSPTPEGQKCFSCTAIDLNNLQGTDNKCITVEPAYAPSGGGGSGKSGGGDVVQAPPVEIPAQEEQQAEVLQEVQEALQSTEEQQVTVDVTYIPQIPLDSVTVQVSEDKSEISANLDNQGSMSITIEKTAEGISKPRLDLNFNLKNKQQMSAKKSTDISNVPFTLNFGLFSIAILI